MPNDPSEVFEASLTVALTLDAEGRVRAFSPGARELFASATGQPLEEGVPLVDAVLPALREQVASRLERARSGEHVAGVVEIELDGAQRVLRSIYVPMLEGGEVRSILLTVFDATTQVLRDGQRRLFEAAMQEVSEGILIADARQRGFPTIWANRGFTEITGYEWEDIMGRSCSILQGRDVDQPGVQQLTGALAAGEPVRATVRNYRKDGTAFWNDISLTPLFRRGGDRPTHYVGVLRDVSAQYELREQLLHASRLDALGQLAGGVVHDFNNLLTAMGMELQMLHEAADQPELVRESAEALEEVVGRAGALVRRLLAMSKPTQVEPDVQAVDAIVERSARMLRRLVESRVELVVVPPEETLWASVDATVIEQALVNFVVNARDAMPRGGTVTVETRGVREGGKEWVEIRVRDTGGGIPEAVLPRVFDSFFTTKGKKGTGLGLATVKRLVEALDGEVSAENDAVGAVFRVRLPRLRSKPAAKRRPTSHSALRRPQTLKLLLLEDQDALRRALARPLQRAGYDVTAVSLPSVARNAMKSLERVDVLVTDIVLPGQSGIEFARWAAELNPELRVVFTTGYADMDVTASGLPPERWRLLTKPFDTRKLVQTIQSLVYDQ